MKKIFKYLGIAILILLLYFGFANYPKLDLISGFSAKSIASGHFIGGRSQQMIESGDNDIKLVDLSKNKINEQEKYATASVYGLKERRAIYREGLGATLINASFDVSKPYLVPKRTKAENSRPYPYGNAASEDSVFSNINYGQLNRAVNNAFDKKEEKLKRTRSLLVLYKDHLAAEKYARGFGKDSKMLGWSMTKSITATYFGILEKQGKISINARAPVSEWAGDERSKITLNDLLRMNSGLEWEEKYDKICDATKMLFEAEDMGRVQLEKPLTGKPGESWNYSSGTTNLLSALLRKQFKTHQEYLDFWYAALIDKIGMHSMVVEPDMAGNFVGSSYAWATTRDWAKFGLLYLRNGKWNGEQLFDEGWAKYVSSPTNTSGRRYGAHFWLNAGGKYPDAPKDMYYASGFQGQKIFIIPSMDMVIVRFGLTDDEAFDFNGLLKEILGSFRQ
ncbi:MAG TPA: serine hydrolase [Flavobacterium sp.]|nr:serine hydrolase [Flavobacterium sp.]